MLPEPHVRVVTPSGFWICPGIVFGPLAGFGVVYGIATLFDWLF